MEKRCKLFPQISTGLGLAIFAAFTFAQAVIPSSLSGRWSTLDGSSSQTISVKIDPATAKGTLTVWSNVSVCNIQEAPITVIAGDNKLTMKVDASWSNSCRADVSVEVSKVPGSDEFVGELHKGGPAGARYPILRVKLSP